MIRFIWQHWWRRKERLMLLLIGALMVSAGLTYLVGISDSSKGMVEETLQDRWTASYDIVVRPKDARSVTEEKGLLEPNYLSGIDGGISVEQYETIKNIQGVDIAAPIAMIGYASYTVRFDPIDVEQNGIYRQQMEQTVHNGARDITSTSNAYFAYGDWPVIEENLAGKGSEYGVGASPNYLRMYTQALLAGIDPEQEARLVGLEEAIVSSGNSRYFNTEDIGESVQDAFDLDYIAFPVIVNNYAFDDKQVHFTIERLDLSFEKNNANDTLEQIREHGGAEYLDTIEGIDAQFFSYSSEEAFSLFINSISGIDANTGGRLDTGVVEDEVLWMNFRPSPLHYQPVTSPYEDRWPYAYQVQLFQTDQDTRPAFVGPESFREPKVFGESSADWPRIKPDWIGFYDPSKLRISRDPANELPMETYRPATAELVIDSDNQPMNPSITLKPTDNPYDFLTNPPNMLTTIDAAEQILGDEPISAIRIKVAGVTEMSDDSQAVLERVAQDIEEQTGLITDITLGSSPQLTLTHVPAVNDEEAIGWLQQPWVNIGSSISIFRETKMGFSGIIPSVVAVAVIYVWASTLVSLLTRRKEFAVLLAVGWRPSQLSRLLFTESFLFGCFVAIVSWGMLGFVYLSMETAISPTRFFLTGLIGFSIYLLGSIVPAIMTRSISPYETMRTGEFSSGSKRILKTRHIFQMAINHFIGKWKRSLLSIIAIALPTGLLAFFLYVTIRLKGIMYTTWLGKYAALEVGAIHYASITVALLIAILTTAEMMWQNIAERHDEISLLKAIGWRNKSIRFLIWSEGVLIGLCAATVGLSFAFGMIWWLYGEFPAGELLFILSTGFIPIMIGVIGTIIPAERAVRIQPSQGMRGGYIHKKSSEKRLKIVLVGASVFLLASFAYVMIQAIPQLAKDANTEEIAGVDSHTPTEGDVQEVSNSPVDEDEDETKTTVEESSTDHVNRYDVVIEAEENLTWWTADFYAKEVERNQSEGGLINVTVEFTYKNTDNRRHQLDVDKNFSLRSSMDPYADIYTPAEITIIDQEKWDEGWLEKDGEVEAIIQFEVFEQDEEYFFHFTSYEYPKGILVVLR